MTRDHARSRRSPKVFPVISCYLPVRSLFRIRREIFKCHGIRVLKACGDQNAGIFPVIFPVNGHLADRGHSSLQKLTMFYPGCSLQSIMYTDIWPCAWFLSHGARLAYSSMDELETL